MRRLGILAAFACAACGDAAGPPATRAWFRDATADAGVDFVHDAGTTDERHLPETMGAGAALVDVDGDGDLDLYLVQGGPMRLAGDAPGAFRDPPRGLIPNRLYLNAGRGEFRDHTGKSGAAADTGYGMGVAAGDVNGDGHLDLYVTNLGPDVLLLGDGTGRFTDGTADSGVSDERWTSGAVFFDADGDRDLDLFVCAYLLVDLANPEWCGDRRAGWRSYCHPDRYPGLADRFWRNRGDGTFEDATAEAGLGASDGKGLGAVASDFDGDGDLDLYVANDSTTNYLWENDGSGHFADATLLSGTGVDGRGLTEAGMGLATGDVDGDSDFDLVVTNFDDESNTLYVNEGAALFTDRTIQAGLEGPSRLPVGFGVVLCDFDEDSDLDLAVTNGHIIHNIELYHDGKTHAQRSQLFAGSGAGAFTELAQEAGALGATLQVGRGLYAADLDGDLDLDLVLTVCDGRARILLNEVGRGDALLLRGLPRGARVEARLESGRVLAREAGPQPSYFGASSPRVHVGLAGERVRSILVRVPGGEHTVFSFEEPRGAGELVFEVGPEGLRLR